MVNVVEGICSHICLSFVLERTCLMAYLIMYITLQNIYCAFFLSGTTLNFRGIVGAVTEQQK